HLEDAAAAQRAQLVDEHRVVLRAPFEARIHDAAVEAGVAIGPWLEGGGLPGHPPPDGRPARRPLARRPSHPPAPGRPRRAAGTWSAPVALATLLHRPSSSRIFDQ